MLFGSRAFSLALMLELCGGRTKGLPPSQLLIASRLLVQRDDGVKQSCKRWRHAGDLSNRRPARQPKVKVGARPDSSSIRTPL